MEENKLECWVYRIKSPSGKTYVGQTKNFNRRYLNYQKLDCKSQRKLYQSLVKYGFESHTIDILFYGELTMSELLDKEADYIAEFDCIGKNGLNICARGGCKPSGERKSAKHTEETKKKISDANRGKKASAFARHKMSINNSMRNPIHAEHARVEMVKAINSVEGKANRSAAQKKRFAESGHHRSKRVHKLTLEGVFVKEYPSTMEASRQEETTDTRISDCCNGKRKTHRGFKWVYA